MQRAEVNVEVCHVEELDKSSGRQTKGKERSKKSKANREKPKPIVSDWETDSDVAVSGWENEDELNASQYLPEDDPYFTLVRKRSADTPPDTILENQPAVKRQRTSVYEVD
jgi:hypothetical protein